MNASDVLRATMDLLERDPEAALSMLEDGLRRARDERESLALLRHAGAVAHGLGRFDDVVRFYTEACSLDANDPHLYLGLGVAHRERGDERAAREAYEKAAALAEAAGDGELAAARPERSTESPEDSERW